MQITPDGDHSRTGVEWNRFGYTNRHHKQFAEAPARSGLYYFHAETARGAASSFPWIVAPEKPSAKVAVLASNITWNAYNNFGGRSNYVNSTGLPATPIVNGRQELDLAAVRGWNVSQLRGWTLSADAEMWTTWVWSDRN